MHHHVRRSIATAGTSALIATALLTAPGAQAAAAVTCQGKAVTIDGTGTATVPAERAMRGSRHPLPQRLALFLGQPLRRPLREPAHPGNPGLSRLPSPCHHRATALAHSDRLPRARTSTRHDGTAGHRPV